ncbi:hypothetical protein DPX16_4319 [Anabarilius grahami]|uniref:Uncharacterized protein n=1 Tax=Anabarilius grahami TaxID=495550 RepID=A0A3N0YEL4_ANAGA|nr:hypothetical protein DPX16_4319 [Anabarilius grahami]
MTARHDRAAYGDKRANLPTERGGPEEARRLGRSSRRRLKRLLQRTQLNSPVGASAGALADCRPERHPRVAAVNRPGRDSGAERLSARSCASSRRPRPRVPRPLLLENSLPSCSPDLISVPLQMRATSSCSVHLTKSRSTTPCPSRLQKRKDGLVSRTTLPPCLRWNPLNTARVWMPSSSASYPKQWKSWTSSGPRRRSHHVAEWFLPGHRQAPRQRSAPFFPEVHQELTKSWRAPYSARLHTTHRSALTAVDGSEQKGYEHLPPLDEAVAAHLCPPVAVGWKTKRALPSKPCRTTSTLAGRAYTSAGQAASALHTMAIFQVFQAKLLRSLDESGVDEPAFRDLRSATDLALRATKATAQAIGHSMASLVVLERHLWLNLTEIKDLDKTAFLDAPVSPSGLFGPAVDGFTKRFTAAQKSSQAMRHFLPKRSSSASAVSRPRPQQSKPATSIAQAAPPKEHHQRSRPPKRPPFPRRQGPRPKIVLDPATPKTS